MLFSICSKSACVYQMLSLDVLTKMGLVNSQLFNFIEHDALPSHGVKPIWGFHKVKLRKVETWRHAPGFQL